MRVTWAEFSMFDVDSMTRSPTLFTWDAINDRFTGNGVEDVGTWILLTQFGLGASEHRPTHMIRRYGKFVEDGCEGDTVLDWYEIWGGVLSLLGDSLLLCGFQRGPKAVGGNHNRYNYDLDQGTPWARVEWRFKV